MVKLITWDATSGRHKEKSHSEITVDVPTNQVGSGLDVFADNDGVPLFIGLLGAAFVPETYKEVMERLSPTIYFEFRELPETYEQVMTRLNPTIYFEFNGVTFVPGSYVAYDTQISNLGATIYYNDVTFVPGSYVAYDTQISNQGATIYFDDFPLV